MSSATLLTVSSGDRANTELNETDHCAVAGRENVGLNLDQQQQHSAMNQN